MMHPYISVLKHTVKAASLKNIISLLSLRRMDRLIRSCSQAPTDPVQHTNQAHTKTEIILCTFNSLSSLIPFWSSCFPLAIWLVLCCFHPPGCVYMVWPRFGDAVVPRVVDHLRPVQISILSHIAGEHCAPSALSLLITDISRNKDTVAYFLLWWPCLTCHRYCGLAK